MTKFTIFSKNFSKNTYIWLFFYYIFLAWEYPCCLARSFRTARQPGNDGQNPRMDLGANHRTRRDERRWRVLLLRTTSSYYFFVLLPSLKFHLHHRFPNYGTRRDCRGYVSREDLFIYLFLREEKNPNNVGNVSLPDSKRRNAAVSRGCARLRSLPWLDSVFVCEENLYFCRDLLVYSFYCVILTWCWRERRR